MTTQFWTNNPMILFNTNQITQIMPLSNMNLEAKMNSITRLVILLSFLGFIFTMKISYILVGLITIILLVLVYKIKSKSMPKTIHLENFANNENNLSVSSNNMKPVHIDSKNLDSFLGENYYHLNKKNPMGNVLLTEISDTPNRKAAPPSFNPDVDENINGYSKKMVQYLNPGIINTGKQLFGDLVDNYNFDWSMRNFYTMPNTKIANDQGALGEWLYSGYPSAKEGDPFAMVRDNLRYILI